MPFHLVEIPTGATKCTVTMDRAGQIAVREYKEVNGVITDSVNSLAWTDYSANVGFEINLTTGMTHVTIATKANASGTTYTAMTSPFKASIDFS